MTFSHNSRLPTPLSESSNSQSFLLSSSSLSSLDSVCEEISTQHNVERNTRSSSPLIMTLDNLDNIQVSIDTTRNDWDKQLNESDGRNTAAFSSKKCKTVVPPSNAFSQQKKNKENNIELLIAKSSSAIQSMAACLTQDNDTNKEKKMHPFVAAIEAAFEKVPNEMEMECFMAVINVISKYQ